MPQPDAKLPGGNVKQEGGLFAQRNSQVNTVTKPRPKPFVFENRKEERKLRSKVIRGNEQFGSIDLAICGYVPAIHKQTLTSAYMRIGTALNGVLHRDTERGSKTVLELGERNSRCSWERTAAVGPRPWLTRH